MNSCHSLLHHHYSPTEQNGDLSQLYAPVIFFLKPYHMRLGILDKLYMALKLNILPLKVNNTLLTSAWV